jgi:hypothetical protein
MTPGSITANINDHVGPHLSGLTSPQNAQRNTGSPEPGPKNTLAVTYDVKQQPENE